MDPASTAGLLAQFVACPTGQHVAVASTSVTYVDPHLVVLMAPVAFWLVYAGSVLAERIGELY